MPSGGYREDLEGQEAPQQSNEHSQSTSLLKPILKTHLTLVDVARNGRTDAAKCAANSLLDRGYGKPVNTEASQPETRVPTVIEIRSPDLV